MKRGAALAVPLVNGAAPSPTIGEVDEFPVYDRISYSVPQAAELVGMPTTLIRARYLYGDYNLYFAGDSRGKPLIRSVDLLPWAEAFEAAKTKAADTGAQWWECFIFDPMEAPPVYSFISCSLEEAARRTGVSSKLIAAARARGDLTAHYAGEKQGKAVYRAADLDAWIMSLPTDRGW